MDHFFVVATVTPNDLNGGHQQQQDVNDRVPVVGRRVAPTDVGALAAEVERYDDGDQSADETDADQRQPKVRPFSQPALVALHCVQFPRCRPLVHRDGHHNEAGHAPAHEARLRIKSTAFLEFGWLWPGLIGLHRVGLGYNMTPFGPLVPYLVSPHRI